MFGLRTLSCSVLHMHSANRGVFDATLTRSETLLLSTLPRWGSRARQKMLIHPGLQGDTTFTIRHSSLSVFFLNGLLVSENEINYPASPSEEPVTNVLLSPSSFEHSPLPSTSPTLCHGSNRLIGYVILHSRITSESVYRPITAVAVVL